MVGSVEENTAIRTLFNAGWAGRTTVAYENEPFTPPNDASFVKLLIFKMRNWKQKTNTKID